MVLKMDWEEPKSEFVMVLPETEIPEPAVRERIPELVIFNPSIDIPSPEERERSPVFPPMERTPVLVMVGV